MSIQMAVENSPAQAKKRKISGALVSMNDSIYAEWPREVGCDSESSAEVHFELDQILRSYSEGGMAAVRAFVSRDVEVDEGHVNVFG
jgi:hypothetical protein